MAFCPVCRSEYRKGFTTCKACGDVALVDELPKKVALTDEEIEFGKPVAYSDSEEAVRVVEVDGVKLDTARIFVLEQAADIKEIIEEQGLPAAIVPLAELTFKDNVKRYEVRVRPDDLSKAQAVLLDAWRKQLDVGDAGAGAPVAIDKCPACGATVPLDVEECPDCELFVGLGSEREAASATE
ncbi:hypothetical protein L6R52_41545 [Myxococcota bacterium]|nr:hypothetical protein [Myxococcota bacterium]